MYKYRIDPIFNNTTQCKGYFNVIQLGTNNKYILFIVPQLIKTYQNGYFVNELFNDSIIKKKSNKLSIQFEGFINMRIYSELQKSTKNILTIKDETFICDGMNVDDNNISLDYNLEYIRNLTKYLSECNMDFLVKEDNDTIIFPYMQEYAITKDDYDVYTNIQNNNDLYRYLQSFYFYLVVKSDDGLFSIKNEKFLSKDVILQYVNKIISFYKKLGVEIDETLVKILVCRNINNRYFTLKFFAFNSYVNERYESFIEENYWMDINRYLIQYPNVNLITRVKANDPNVNEQCKDNIEFNTLKFIGGNITKISDFFKKYNKIEIVNLYASNYDTEGLGRYVSKDIINLKINCTWVITIKADNELYNLNITSKIFNNPDIKYIENNINNQFFDMKIPVGVKLYKIKYLHINLIMNEKISIYESYLDTIINTNQIDILLIISLIYLTEYYNNYSRVQIIKKILNGHPIFDKFFNDRIYFSENGNFVIYNKTLNYLKHITSTNNLFVLWYLPKIKITNEDTFYELLNKIRNEYTMEEIFTIHNTNENSELINKSTNFYGLFKVKNEFVYNIRHLNEFHKKEINNLIFNFYKLKYMINAIKYNGDDTILLFDPNNVDIIRGITNRIIFKNKVKEYIKKYPFTSFCHYPNSNKWQVFHMHITNYDSETIIDLSLLQNQTIRYHNTADLRSMTWKYIKNTNLRNADIITSTKFINDENIIEQISKYKIGPITFSLNDIVDILTKIKNYS